MDRRACGVVKLSRVAFERFVGQPAKENQREDRSPETKQQ
jgi:hypothetical protein